MGSGEWGTTTLLILPSAFCLLPSSLPQRSPNRDLGAGPANDFVSEFGGGGVSLEVGGANAIIDGFEDGFGNSAGILGAGSAM